MTKTRFSEFLYTKQTGVVSDTGVEDHSGNSVSYLKGLRIIALESLEALKMYYVIGTSVPSLHSRLYMYIAINSQICNLKIRSCLRMLQRNNKKHLSVYNPGTNKSYNK